MKFIPAHLAIQGRLSSQLTDSRLGGVGAHLPMPAPASNNIKRRGRGEERGLEMRVLCLRACKGLSVGGKRGEVRRSFPSPVPKYQHSPGEGGTTGGYNTNSTRVVRGCEVWLSRAPGPGSFVLWPCSSIKLHLISLPSASQGSRDPGSVLFLHSLCSKRRRQPRLEEGLLQFVQRRWCDLSFVTSIQRSLWLV